MIFGRAATVVVVAEAFVVLSLWVHSQDFLAVLGKAVFDFYARGSISMLLLSRLVRFLARLFSFSSIAGVIGKVELLEMWEGGCGCRDEYGCGCMEVDVRAVFRSDHGCG